MSGFVFRTPEVDSIGSNNPLQMMRRSQLFDLAIKKGLIDRDQPTPTKEELIMLIETAPEMEIITLERAKTLRHFGLLGLCKKVGIECDKTSTREYLLEEYEKILREL